MRRSQTPKAGVRIAIERRRSAAVADDLWRGLIAYSRDKAGPARYARIVISARDAEERLLGGLILESYFLESYVELLWVSPKARGQGLGEALLAKAEGLARGRGSRLIHLNTYSFQAPKFYQRQGYRRFGSLSGSPRGARRHFYVKRLERA
ncbi:MAG TPA: GNAT family N-acetyltransferase [Burkholderiales bacterium]|nr:GNAT family N-acetyltransferase [Burkholderiales bacterium]